MSEMCFPHTDRGIDAVLSVNVESRTIWLVFSEGMCASPFHFKTPDILNTPDVSLCKDVIFVTWDGSLGTNLKPITCVGTSSIEAPLLKNKCA